MLCLVAAFSLAQQLVPNGSFEDFGRSAPVGWSKQTWDGTLDLSRSSEAHSGKSSVLLSSTAGADAGCPVHIPVKMNAVYKITGWVKTDGLTPVSGQGAVLNLHGRQDHTTPLKGTNDWTKVEMTVKTDSDDVLVLNCLIGYYGTAKGKAWFDDISVELISSEPIHPSATLNPGTTYEPISKYIYSQFIEHLGRCIYGGIWAEMLQDRKFYYSVGSNQSPWTGSVTMDRKDKYTNTQSLVVNGSVQQGRLWLEKGRSLAGYVVVKGNKGQHISVDLNGSATPITLKSGGWEKFPIKVTPTASTQTGALRLSSPQTFRLGTASLMPADNVHGMRPDTLALLKRLNAPLYRWPGGNFASGYDWRDGLGDPDKRPVRKNPAWEGIDSNDFGLHEFMQFCKEIKTEPLLVVNAGFGDAYSAAQWVEYTNGSATTEQGAKRAKAGQKEPWNVKWWGIGNEMFGEWQLGYMAEDQYIVKHGMFYDRMKAVDPTIQTIGVGEIGGDWSKKMLEACGGQMTLMSEHFYCQEAPGVASHASLIPKAIRAKVAAHRKLRDSIPGLKEKHVKIAMDEWNYWYGPHVFGELGTRYFMKDALGIAEGFHEYYRSTDMVGMAQYAQTVNVIGAIKTTPTQAAMESTGLVLELYRREFGTIPFEVKASAPVDVMGAWKSDRSAITLGLVNPTGEAIEVPLTWSGVLVSDRATLWEIANSDPMSHNDPGKKDVIGTTSRVISGVQKSITLKPYSVNVVVIPVQK